MEGEASVGFLYPKMWFGSMTSWEGDHFDVLVVCLRGFTHPWWLAGFLPSTVWLKSTKLGGFKYFFIFTPKIAHDFQFDEHISLMGGSTLVQPPTSKHLEQHVGSFAINKKNPYKFSSSRLSEVLINNPWRIHVTGISIYTPTFTINIL